MTDALHLVATIWVGFHITPLKSATVFSVTFVAVRAPLNAVYRHAAQDIVPISTTSLFVLYACEYSFSKQRHHGCDASFRGSSSSSRAKFCTDVAEVMGRGEYSTQRITPFSGAHRQYKAAAALRRVPAGAK